MHIYIHYTNYILIDHTDGTNAHVYITYMHYTLYQHTYNHTHILLQANITYRHTNVQTLHTYKQYIHARRHITYIH